MLKKRAAFKAPQRIRSVQQHSPLYVNLLSELRGLVAGERDFIANAANCAALLYHRLPNVNWAGFYLLQDKQLVLGPFQWESRRASASTWARESAERRRAPARRLSFPTSEKFAGHIACDAASRSEIVTCALARKRS